jgi:hypothetical protein
MSVSRRLFLATAPAAPLFFPDFCEGQAAATIGGGLFPSHDPATVLEMVTVSHGNAARVRVLLADRPALANAASRSSRMRGPAARPRWCVTSRQSMARTCHTATSRSTL